MQNELSFLIELQSHDATLRDLDKKISELSDAIAKKNQEIASLKLGSKTSKEKLMALQLKKKQLEANADEQEKLVRKHQGELNSLKTNEAYKGMLAEIDTAKKSQTAIEDDILTTMEAIDGAEREAKEIEGKLKSDESVIRQAVQQIESEKSQLESQHVQKNQEREAFAAAGPAPVRAQYESIRKKRDGVAIVPSVNNTCSGCQMKLTQNKIIEIKISKSMVLCDSCTRILYLPPEAAPAVPAPTQPAPTV